MCLVSCDRNSIAENILAPDTDFNDQEGFSYSLETGYDSKDAVNGDKVWLFGNGMFQDPQNGNIATSLTSDDPSKKILLGTVSTTTPIAGMSTKVLIRPIPENDNLPGVRFALEKVNGDWEILWSVPTLKKYNSAGVVVATYSCGKMLYKSSPAGSFPANRPKVYIPYFTFGVNYAGEFFTRGTPVASFVEKTFVFDGVSAYTANGTSLIALTPNQIPNYSEPCNSTMDLKIRWSGSQWYTVDMTWNTSLSRWEVIQRLDPNQPFNFTMFESANPGTPKVFGVNVGEAELMNLYDFYAEFLTTGKTVSGTVQNIEPVDLRGEWAGVGPQ